MRDGCLLTALLGLEMRFALAEHEHQQSRQVPLVAELRAAVVLRSFNLSRLGGAGGSARCAAHVEPARGVRREPDSATCPTAT